MTADGLYRELKSRFPAAALRIDSGRLSLGRPGAHGSVVSVGEIDQRAAAETPMHELARLSALVAERIREGLPG